VPRDHVSGRLRSLRPARGVVHRVICGRASRRLTGRTNVISPRGRTLARKCFPLRSCVGRTFENKCDKCCILAKKLGSTLTGECDRLENETLSRHKLLFHYITLVSVFSSTSYSEKHNSLKSKAVNNKIDE